MTYALDVHPGADVAGEVVRRVAEVDGVVTVEDCLSWSYDDLLTLALP